MKSFVLVGGPGVLKGRRSKVLKLGGPLERGEARRDALKLKLAVRSAIAYDPDFFFIWLRP